MNFSFFKTLGCFFLIFNCHSQYDIALLKAYRSRDITKCENILSKLDKKSIEYNFYDWSIELSKTGIANNLKHQTLLELQPKNYHDSIFLNIHNSDFAYQSNEQSKAFRLLEEAFVKANKNNDSLLGCRILYRILIILGRNPKLKHFNTDYVEDYYDLAPDDYELTNALYFDFSFNYRFSTTKFKLKDKAFKLANSLDFKFPLIELNQRVGIVYDVYLKKSDSAKLFYKNALHLLDSFNEYDFVQQRKKGLLNNLGCIYYGTKDYRQALKYFDTAYKITSSKKRLVNDSIIVDWKIKTHERLMQSDSALFYSKLKDSISRELAQEKYAIQIEEQKRKYDNEKLRADNLVSSRSCFALWYWPCHSPP